MELDHFGYHRQSRFREQFYPRGISALYTATSLGLAEYAVLAQTDQVNRPDTGFVDAYSLDEGAENSAGPIESSARPVA